MNVKNSVAFIPRRSHALKSFNNTKINWSFVTMLIHNECQANQLLMTIDLYAFVLSHQSRGAINSYSSPKPRWFNNLTNSLSLQKNPSRIWISNILFEAKSISRHSFEAVKKRFCFGELKCAFLCRMFD